MTTHMTTGMPPSIGWTVTASQAITELKSGQTVALPTETVYGLAALAYDDKAIDTIYRIKKRPAINPLIVHYAHWQDTEVDVIWQPWALTLAQSVWPGPVTFVLPLRSTSRISLRLTAGLSTIAVRVPNHPMMLHVLRECASPLAAPSANISGQLSPTKVDHVLQNVAVAVVDGGPCMLGVESTIIDATGPQPVILRHGAWEGEDALIHRHLAPTRQEILAGQTGESGQQNSCVCPGQLLAHYAPRKKLRMNALTIEEDEGLLAFGPPCAVTPWMVQLSIEKHLEQAATNLFAGLFDLDHMPCSRIAVMPIPFEGVGMAINDRLKRAAISAGP